jgi:hypothetical protein
MRMWMINPKFLCKKHLLGEHGEIHKFRHTFVKQYSIKGRISPVVQIEPFNMKKRHDELVLEFERRGYNHKSPYEMPDISYLTIDEQNVKVDIKYNIKDLIKRCPDCREKYKKHKGV